MAKIYLRAMMPDELQGEFLQSIRDFDMKHDPEHHGKVEFEALSETDWPVEKVTELFEALKPRPAHMMTVLNEKGVEDLRKAEKALATFQDCFEQLGVKTLAELIAGHERGLQEAEQAKALIEQDEQCRAVYLYFQPERRRERGAAVETRTVEAHVDLDADGNVFGVEIVEPLRLRVEEPA